MSSSNYNNYNSFRIPSRKESIESDMDKKSYRQDTSLPAKLPDGMYYEIEYDSGPMPGVGKYVLKSQKIETPIRDEVRDMFDRMRDIARKYRHSSGTSGSFFNQLQQNNSIIFYKQGMFMKDFIDDYQEKTVFENYFPYYQIMGYEQLRTYFTWRTKIRQGIIEAISLSYAFLYIYELLGNIGVDNPHEGLEKLIYFWKEFRIFDSVIDKYLPGWLKDYYIYYGIEGTFADFISKYELTEYFPEADKNSNEKNIRFNMFCTVSKYDIRKSNFYTGENIELINNCFDFVLGCFTQELENRGIKLENILFLDMYSQSARRMSVWSPFKKALFFPWLNQSDRMVAISDNEVYVCTQNRWTFRTKITNESSRKLFSFIFREMESVLREIKKFKHKLTASADMIDASLLEKFSDINFPIKSIVRNSVLKYYHEITKTVVRVDPEALEKIRQDAAVTQEKLIIQENNPIEEYQQTEEKIVLTNEIENSGFSDCWTELKKALTGCETDALTVILSETHDLKSFADDHEVMLEVLIDTINEKAFDYIGDSLIDEDFQIYEDYRENIKEIILK